MTFKFLPSFGTVVFSDSDESLSNFEGEALTTFSLHFAKLAALLLTIPGFCFLLYCAAYQTSLIAMNLTTNEDINFGLFSSMSTLLPTCTPSTSCQTIPPKTSDFERRLTFYRDLSCS